MLLQTHHLLWVSAARNTAALKKTTSWGFANSHFRLKEFRLTLKTIGFPLWQLVKFILGHVENTAKFFGVEIFWKISSINSKQDISRSVVQKVMPNWKQRLQWPKHRGNVTVVLTNKHVRTHNTQNVRFAVNKLKRKERQRAREREERGGRRKK